VAHFWNMKPSAFWASSIEDRIYMKSYMQIHFEIKAVEDFELEKKIERQNRKPKKR
jgi:hypothetical protein